VGAGRGGREGAARGEGWERGLAVDGRGKGSGGRAEEMGVGAQVYRPPHARHPVRAEPAGLLKRPPHTGRYP